MKPSPSLSAAEVKAAARGRWREILIDVAGISADLLDGRGHPCPKCGGTDRFILVDADAGAVLCRHCFCEKNGDGLAAVAWMLGTDFPATINRVAEHIGMGWPASAKPRQSRMQANGKPAGKVYATAAEAVAELKRRHGPPSADWAYHSADGEPVGMILRWDRPDGDKDIKPISRNGDGWHIGGMPEPRPLYGLPDLVSASTVYVVEGEKAADAARSIGLVATTSPHGAQSAGKADWSPLAGKDVVILPDHDEAGERYLADVVEMLLALTPQPKIKIVRLAGLPDGGDLVDWIDAHGDACEPSEYRRQLEALVEAAAVVDLSADDQRPEGPVAVVVNLADVKPRPITWLWPQRIAVGKLTVISGDPGLGKSFLTLDLTARVTNGRKWPDDAGTFAPLGSVVILSAEDDLEDTIVPRLIAAGADLNRIKAIQAVRGTDDAGRYDRLFDLSRDIPRLESVVRGLQDCRMVVIDPISAYLGKTKSHDNAEVRGVLAPLAEMAGRLGVAVIAVSHLRKGEGPALYRTMGSMAFVAAARAAFSVSKDRDDVTGKRRLFLPLKNNIGNDETGLAFKLSAQYRGSSGQPCVVWEPGVVDTKADDALAPATRGRKPEEREEAVEFLREALANGPRLVKDLVEEASHGHGISKRTLDRAKAVLNVKPERETPTGPWLWKLPAGHTATPTMPEPYGSTIWHSGNVDENTGETDLFDAPEAHIANIPVSGNLDAADDRTPA